MNARIGLGLVLLLSTGLFAQNNRAYVNPQPVVRRDFGNVVFPGGTQATTPGVQRSFGNVTFPGSGGPRVNIPFSITDPTFGPRLGANVAGQGVGQIGQGAVRGDYNGRNQRSTVLVPFAYPVYVGDYSYQGAYAAQQPYGTQQPNITVIYPPAPAQPVYMYGGDQGQAAAPVPETPNISVYQAPSPQPAAEGSSTADPARYLIAYKDHTIYAAVAYWVDGDTLHYFTSGNTHNQISLSLVDVPLTERLNREAGNAVRLPQ